MDRRFGKISVISMLLLFTGTVLATAIVSTAVNSTPTFSSPLNLSNDAYQARYPWIANSGSNIYVAWTEESHGIWFRSSPNNGTTWNPPLTSSGMKLSETKKGIGTAQYPIVYANNSDVYVTWSQSVNTSGANVLQVFFAGSTNYGASFSSAIQLTSGSSFNGWITPVIAASGSNVYIAYTGNGKNSYVVWSNDYGVTWHGPLHYAVTHEPQIAAWGTNAYAIADGVQIEVTNNAGGTWTQISSATNQGDEPWIATSDSYVYIVSQTKGTHGVIHFFYSNNYGKAGSWVDMAYSEQMDLSSVVPQHDAWEPQIVAIGNYVYLTFHEVNSPVNSYVRVSNDNGQTWGPAILLTTNSGLSGFPTQLATSGCNGGYSCFGSLSSHVFTIWPQVVNVNGGHNWDMFISSSSDYGITWTSQDVSNNPGTSGPNNDIATSSITAFGDRAFAVWQDNSIAPGNYQILFVSSSTSSATSSSSSTTTTSVTSSTTSSSTTTTHSRQMVFTPNPIIHAQSYQLTGVGFPKELNLTLYWKGGYGEATNIFSDSSGGFTTTQVAPTPAVLGTTHTLVAEVINSTGTFQYFQINVIIE